ncbi:hypothetical protein KW478_19475 [Vibrio fluvialis]|uniref:hypothetical protein n=1 Tax=Vibrio fluvialis TaxID=676 RepID=UPI0005CA2FC5|nr:hypothetical protein [Vibrio fluvialis]MBY7898677.1 hypothetical protein [Vibrio fluvialis]MBY8084686.1 hypothetical protein [Vibrio fluvialis]
MYKKYLMGSCFVFLAGCSSITAKNDFEDAIDSVSETYDHIAVVARKVTPNDVTEGGSNVVQVQSYAVAVFPKPNSDKSAESFLSTELRYFQTYGEYSTASIDGKRVTLKPYKLSTNACSEHCTVTQYVQFPIDESEMRKASEVGLKYAFLSDSGNAELTFFIPANYFKAIEREGSRVSNAMSNQSENIQRQPTQSFAETKATEMTKHWYREANQQEREIFSNWAFNNRKGVSSSLTNQNSSRALEMMAYWYEKADKTQKAAILSWLISQE